MNDSPQLMTYDAVKLRKIINEDSKFVLAGHKSDLLWHVWPTTKTRRRRQMPHDALCGVDYRRRQFQSHTRGALAERTMRKADLCLFCGGEYIGLQGDEWEPPKEILEWVQAGDYYYGPRLMTEAAEALQFLVDDRRTTVKPEDPITDPKCVLSDVLVQMDSVQNLAVSLAFWSADLLKLARELQKDLKRFYVPEKGWPPHIERLEGTTDFDTVIENAQQAIREWGLEDE